MAADLQNSKGSYYGPNMIAPNEIWLKNHNNLKVLKAKTSLSVFSLAVDYSYKKYQRVVFNPISLNNSEKEIFLESNKIISIYLDNLVSVV